MERENRLTQRIAQLEATCQGLESQIRQLRDREDVSLLSLHEAKAQEQKYRAIFDRLNLFIILLQPDGIVVEVNQTALDFWGAKLSDVVGKYFWEISSWEIASVERRFLSSQGSLPRWHQRKKAKNQGKIKKAIAASAKGELMKLEVDMQPAIGEKATIDFSFKPILDETGRVTLLVIEGKDTGYSSPEALCGGCDRESIETQAAIAELQQTRKFLQTIVDRLPVAVFVKDATEENFGKFKLWNKTCETICGISADRVIDKTDYDIFPKEQADFFRQKDLEAIARRIPEDIACEPIDSYTLGRRLLHTIKVPIYDESDAPEYLLCISEDITEKELALRERQLAEAALRESEAKHSSLMNDVLEQSEVGIFILDANFQVVWINQALERYFGVRREDIIGLDKRKLIRDRIRYIFEDAESFANTVIATYENNTYIENFECHILPDRGRKERWLQHLSQPIRFGLYAGGRIEHYTDITSRKLAEAELQRVNRALKTISNCNQALVRATTEADLLKDICQICVIIGGYRLAWVGFVRDVVVGAAGRVPRHGADRKPSNKEEKTLVPVAKYGLEGCCLDNLNITWADPQRGRGPIDTAVRMGTHSIFQNIPGNPYYPDWRERALECGFAAAIAIPLIADDIVFGVFNLYSDSADAFDQEEVKLLLELADDIAYGILALRAHQAHLESEEKFRQLAENIQDVFWIANADETEIIYVSPAYEEIWGRKCESIYTNPKSYLDSIHPEDRDRVFLPIQRDTSASFDVEFRIVRPDGAIRWIWDRGFAIANDSGEIYRRAGIAKDITERKEADLLLRLAKEELEIRVQERTAELEAANKRLQQELKQRLQAEQERSQLIEIVEATTDFISSSTLDGQIAYLNQAARKILGLSPEEELNNKNIDRAYPDWAMELIQTEGIPTAIREGTWLGETALLSHDGREIPLSQLIIAHKTASFSPLQVVKDVAKNSSVYLLSTIARDITQQKQSEATLREAGRRWRNLLENVRLLVVGLDGEGRVEYVNPFFLELTGYETDEVLGKSWFKDFLPKYQQPKVSEYFQEILQQEFHPHYQNSILTSSGEEKIVAWNNTLLQNLQGETIGTMSIGEDITERYAIERMKDEFISVVSHELRTPLTSIHGALNLLSSGLVVPGSDRGDRVLKIAAESAERLVRLVNDILELERLESGKMSLCKSWVDATDLLHQAAEQMQVMANRGGISLEVYARELKLYADPDRILQVLTNLLSNAIKFSPTGSQVCLTVMLSNSLLLSLEGWEELSGAGETSSPSFPFEDTAPILERMGAQDSEKVIIFKVKDEGRGIPADKIDTIFERFHQVDASDSRKKEGTGLGLAICRSIVEQHGGCIWVNSVLDRGSSFYFSLPINTLEENANDNK